MAKEKSVIEQALLEAEQIDATFKANAKEILTQTMGSEIEDMVKESLEGSPKANEEEDDDLEMATDLELGDDDDDDDDDELDLELGDDELEGGDMDVIDLTDSGDEELIKVFKAMDPDSEIEVVQDEDGISFTDTETGAEYKVELGGVDTEMDYDIDDIENDIDDIENDVDDIENDVDDIENDEEVIDLEGGDELEVDDDDDYMEEEEEVVYEIEISDDDNDEVEEGGDSLEEAPRTMSKLKGRKYGNPKRRVESKKTKNKQNCKREQSSKK